MLLLLLVVFGIPLAHADMIPPGQKVVSVCAKVSNLAQYPKLTLVMLTKIEDQTKTQSVLTGDTCVSSTGKYEWYDIFAVDATQYTKDQANKSYDFYTDPNAYPVMTIDGFDKYLPDTDKTDKITRYYNINGVDNNKKYASATLTAEDTNLLATDYTPTIPAGMEDHINLNSPVFNDVDSSSPYYNALSYLRKNGIVNGYDDNTFKPDQSVNRAEFVKILFAYFMGKDYTPDCKTDLFKDVVKISAADPWYYNYVCYAVDTKAVSGYDDGTFKPEQNIVFSEAAKIIAKGEYLTDETAVSDPWYKVYVDTLAGVNAIPTTITSFSHQMTRGEMAEMIFRMQAKVTTLPSMAYSGIK